MEQATAQKTENNLALGERGKSLGVRRLKALFL